MITPPDQCATFTVTAFAGGVELGQLDQKGDRYVGRFTLDGTPIDNVEVQSSLGGCAQRALPSVRAQRAAEPISGRRRQVTATT